jgi:hypothetical protein
MSPPIRRAFLALTLFLVLAPLATVRPGLPPTLKADEPAYFLMAASLAHDFDLRCEPKDIDRIVGEFPFAPINNVILMSADNWESVYFGKPYVYSLLAAPLVALFGYNGMLACNMLLVALMIWCGARYLSRFNSEATSLLFSAVFFLLGPPLVYAFWAHPEVFNMTAVTVSLYFVLSRPKEGPAEGSRRRPFWGIGLAPLASGAALALGAYNKPVLAALAVPVAVALWRRSGRRAVVAWTLAAALTGGLLAGVSWQLTGTGSAYLGVDRTGTHLDTASDFDEQIARAVVTTARRHNANSWQWIAQRPDFDLPEFLENFRYLLVGRHTGVVPYMPMGVLAILLFLLRGRRSVSRWLLLAAFFGIAVFFLVAIPINWHGGGGFVGNRYMAMVYPVFLFLVTSVTPAWAPVLGTAAAALLLGPILLTPYGAPVPHPTLQAHVRSPVFRIFPFELTLHNRIPGYAEAAYGRILFLARRDVMRNSGGRMQIQSGPPVEFWVLGPAPVESFLFEVRSRVPDNEVRLEMGDASATVDFPTGHKGWRHTHTVELSPSGPSRTSWFKPVRFRAGGWAYVYKLWVQAKRGDVTEAERRRGGAWMPVGAEITYLGSREQSSRPEHYRIAWDEVTLEPRVSTGERFTVTARISNLSESDWDPNGALPVLLSYHWLDTAGQTVQFDGRRSDLPAAVASGDSALAEIQVTAPKEPGDYLLVLDAIREPIAWFSARGGATFDAPVEVVAGTAPADGTPAAATEDSPEP